MRSPAPEAELHIYGMTRVQRLFGLEVTVRNTVTTIANDARLSAWAFNIAGTVWRRPRAGRIDGAETELANSLETSI